MVLRGREVSHSKTFEFYLFAQIELDATYGLNRLPLFFYLPLPLAIYPQRDMMEILKQLKKIIFYSSSLDTLFSPLSTNTLIQPTKIKKK